MSLTEYTNIGFFPYGNGVAPVHLDSATGYLYQVRMQSTSLYMMRSTDNGATWSVQGGAQTVFTGSDKYVDSFYDGSVIHVATVDTTNAIGRYHAFTISSNSWTTVSTTVFAGDSVATSRACSIVVRSSGDIVVAYQGATERSKGTDYERISVYENTGGGFGSAITIGTGVNSHYILTAGMVVDDGARVWLAYTIGTSAGNQYARYLADGSTSLSSEITTFSGSYQPLDGYGNGATGGAIVQHTHGASTDRKTFFAHASAADGGIYAVEIDGTGSPSTPERLMATAASWTVNTSSVGRQGAAVDDANDKVYAVGSLSDNDAWHGTDTGSGFDTGTDHNNTDTVILRTRPAILTRSDGQVVLAYITYNNVSTNFDYNEWELVAGSGGTITITAAVLSLASSPQTSTITPGAVSLTMGSPSLVSAAQSFIITITTAVVMNTMSLVSSAEAATVIPGLVSVLASEISASISAVTSSVLPGAVSPAMTSVVSSFSPEILSVLPGAVNLTMVSPSLVLSAQTSTVLPGAISLLMNTLTLDFSPEVVSVFTATAVVLNALSMTSSAEAISVLAGAVQVLMNPGSLALSAEALQAVPGAIAAIMNTISLISSSEASSVAVGASTVVLNSLLAAFSAVSGSVIPGEVTLLMTALAIASTAEAFTVIPGGVSVVMTPASATFGPQTITVSIGAVDLVISLNTVSVSVSSVTASVVPGAVQIILNSLSSNLTATTSSIIPGLVSLLMNTLETTTSADLISIIPGAIAVLLSTVNLASTTEQISIPLVVLAQVLAITASAESSSIQPGAVSVLVQTINSILTPETAGVTLALLVGIVDSLDLHDRELVLELIERIVTLTVHPRDNNLDTEDR